MEFRGGWQRSSRQPSEPQRLGWVQPSPPYWLSISQEPTRSEAPCEPWRAERGEPNSSFPFSAPPDAAFPLLSPGIMQNHGRLSPSMCRRPLSALSEAEEAALPRRVCRR